MSPTIYVCGLERLKRPNTGALGLVDCYIDRIMEYLVVTMHQAHLFLKLRLLPRSFFKCQALPYSIRSFQAIVPDKSIYRTALARFDPRTTLAFAFD